MLNIHLLVALVAFSHRLFGSASCGLWQLSHGTDACMASPSIPWVGLEGAMATRAMPLFRTLRAPSRKCGTCSNPSACHRGRRGPTMPGPRGIAVHTPVSGVIKGFFRRGRDIRCIRGVLVDEVLRSAPGERRTSGQFSGTVRVGPASRCSLIVGTTFVREPRVEEPAHETEHCKHADGDRSSLHRPPT